MSYVRDNGLERARRRREQRSLAILIACGLLVIGAIVFAATFMSKPSGSAKNAACPTGTASTVVPAESTFTLNVYNSGDTKGAAGEAANALRSHEFSVGVVGNDPYRRSVQEAGEIRFGPSGAVKARQYVAKYAPGAKLMEDGRDGTSVDLVIGPDFPSIQAASSSPSTTVVCK